MAPATAAAAAVAAVVVGACSLVALGWWQGVAALGLLLVSTPLALHLVHRRQLAFQWVPPSSSLLLGVAMSYACAVAWLVQHDLGEARALLGVSGPQLNALGCTGLLKSAVSCARFRAAAPHRGF